MAYTTDHDYSANFIEAGDDQDEDTDEESLYDGSDGSDVDDVVTDSQHVGLDDNGDLNNYRCISSQEILSVMNAIVQEIQGIMGMINPTVVRALLNQYNWDKASLLENVYMNAIEVDKKKPCSSNLQEDDQLDHAVANLSLGKNKTAPDGKEEEQQECGICCDDEPDTLVGLDCGHKYCKYCWMEFLRTKIIDEGQSQTISCPTMNCETVVDDELVTGLITDESVLTKYNRLVANDFVRCNRKMKWCPTPDCSHVIQVEDMMEIVQVECKCKRRFCFKCGGRWHAPVTCYFMKKWEEVEHQENATISWIKDNTRNCPHCYSVIQKNGGCNHMVCRQCKAQFCWSCMDKLCTGGGGCRTQLREAEVKLKAKQNRKKTYYFYFEHYHNHRKSLGFEDELRARIADYMDSIAKNCEDRSFCELKFLERAADVLVKCRETLMHTYVFSYFLLDNNQLDIFKHNQADLQNVTEELSGILERNVDVEVSIETIEKMRIPIREKTAYCRSRRKALIEHIYEGYEEEWWSLTE